MEDHKQQIKEGYGFDSKGEAYVYNQLCLEYGLNKESGAY